MMLTKFALLILVLRALGAEYSTYIGDTYPYQSAAITTDAAGNAYIAGSRLILTLPETFTSRDRARRSTFRSAKLCKRRPTRAVPALS